MKALTLTEFITASFAEKDVYLQSIGITRFPPYISNFYNNLLSREFTLDTITELFRGWECISGGIIKNGENSISRDRNLYGDYYLRYIKNKKEYWESNIFPEPKTLHDFISDCERLGIELEFKEGALK